MTAADETPAQPTAWVVCAASERLNVDGHASRSEVRDIAQRFWRTQANAALGALAALNGGHATVERDAQPDAAPAPDGNAGGADVYREAAKAMFELADGDNDDLFEWQNCPACPNGVRCACSGIPYPSAAVRAAIDAAITALYLGLTDGEPIDAVLRRRTVEQAGIEIAEAETKRIRAHERCVSRADLLAVRRARDAAQARTDGGEWTTRYYNDAEQAVRNEWWSTVPGPSYTRQRRVWIGPVEPVTDAGGAG